MHRIAFYFFLHLIHNDIVEGGQEVKGRGPQAKHVGQCFSEFKLILKCLVFFFHNPEIFSALLTVIEVK